MKRTLAAMILTALAVGCQNDLALRHAGQGQLALDRGNLEVALAEFEQAIQLDPSLATAYSGMGDVFCKQGQADRAVAPYQRAIQAMPFEFAYHFRLGTAYECLDRDLEAAKTYEDAAQIDPDNAPVNINLGVVYFRLGMAAPDKQVRAQTLQKGRSFAEKAVALAPNHGFAWSNLGAIYDGLGDAYRAVGAYRKSLLVDPDQAPVHVNLGTLYLAQGRLDKALEEFKLAQAIDPGSIVVRKRLGYVYGKQKKFGAAIEQWQEVLRKDPDDCEVRNNLAAVYMIFYLRRPEQDHIRVQALEEWRQSLEICADQPQVQAMLARWSKPIAGAVPRLADEAATEAMIDRPAEGPWVARDHGDLAHLYASTCSWTAPALVPRLAGHLVSEP